MAQPPAKRLVWADDYCSNEVKDPSSSSSSSGAAPSYWALVRNNRQYRLYLLSYIFNHIGEWLTYLASMNAIEEIQLQQQQQQQEEQEQEQQYSTSQTMISILVIIRYMPNVILGPIGGVLADGCDRRHCMILLDLAGACVAVLFILAYQYRSIPLIYLATFCQECCTGLYEPSRSAIVPLLTPKEEDMKKATTLAGLAWSTVAAFGSALGGILVAVVGIQWCYAIDALTYLISAVLIFLIDGSWTIPSEEHYKSIWDAIKSMLVDGIVYLQSSYFGALVLIKSTACLTWGAIDVLNVSFSAKAGGGGGDEEGRETRLGFIFASVGVGCLIGPLLAERFTNVSDPKSLQLACLYAFGIVMTGCLFMSAAHTPFWLTCIFSGWRSMGSSILWINSSLLLQKLTSPEMFGRVSSIDYSLALLCESISAYAAGVLQDQLHMSAEQVAFALSILTLALIIAWSTYHSMGMGAADPRALVPTTNSYESLRKSLNLIHEEKEKLLKYNQHIKSYGSDEETA